MVTPGGELEKNESLEQAAQRELFEETGITDASFLTPHVWYSEVELILKGNPILFKEHFFVAHTNLSAIVTDHYTPEEKICINNHAWWSLEELQKTSDVVYPKNLISLIKNHI